MSGCRIVIRGDHDLAVEEFDAPAAAAPGEYLIRVHYSLISPGTELGAYKAPGQRPKPINPGYTAVGEVIDVGADGDPDLKGKMAYVFPAIDDCRHCHASHKVVKAGGLTLPLPHGLDPRTACFARIVNIALTPYRNAEAKTTGTALVIGLGLVGNMIGQVGRIRGFQTIGMDLDATRRQRASDAGFDATIDPNACDPLEAVKALTDGRGADLTVNATGNTSVFPLAIDATAKGGEVSTLGGAKTSFECDIKPIFTAIHSRHVTVRGGWEMLLPMTTSPASKGASTEVNLRDAFRWLASGAVKLDPIWTHTIQPEQFKAAYDALEQLDPAYLGVVVDWTGA